MKKAILFDFDGTVVDSMNDLANIAAAVMNKNYKLNRDFARRLYLETSGLPFCEQIEIIFPGHNLNKSSVEEFEGTKEKEFLNHTLYSDTKDTLNYLMEKGYVVAISSNNFEHIIEKFFEMQDFKVNLVLGYKPGFSKGRDHFQCILESLKLGKSEMIFIGDSIQDGKKAFDFGIDFIGKEGINNSQDFKTLLSPDVKVVNSLSDLKNVF